MIIYIYTSFAIYFISQLTNNFMFIYISKIHSNNTFINDDDDNNLIEPIAYNQYAYNCIDILNSLHFFYAFIFFVIMCNSRYNLNLKLLIYEMLVSNILCIIQIILFYQYFVDVNSNNINIIALNKNNIWTIINILYLAIFNFINLINYNLIKHYSNVKYKIFT
jgi:hypothetical protein